MIRTKGQPWIALAETADSPRLSPKPVSDIFLAMIHATDIRSARARGATCTCMCSCPCSAWIRVC